MSPEDTVARVRPFFAPLGITRVANVTGLDFIGIPVVQVCRPNSRSLAVSQGKGIDAAAAKASGVMESIELYHAERINHPLVLSSWNEIRFARAVVPVDGLPRISISTFHPNKSLLWIEGTDLFGSGSVWLPFEVVHTNFTLPFPTGSGCFAMSSNGLASGNNTVEAVVHALCEVIERDAATLWFLRGPDAQKTTRLDLETISDANCRALLDRYESAGVAVAVWDITSDVGIASFRCVIMDREPNPFRRLGAAEGMGCHPAREVALLRALTEAAQSRLTLVAGSRDDTGRARYGSIRSDEVSQRIRTEVLERGTRAFTDTPGELNETLEEDLEAISQGLRAAGLSQAVVVDLTKPEFEIPVVRVVVPGLEPYHNVPGRVLGQRAERQLVRSREQKS